MSSSSVCPGLQSCLESRTIEPRVLRMKLTPPKSNFYESVAAPTSTPGFTHPDNLKKESHTEENNTTTTLALTSTANNDCDVRSQRNVDDVVRGWSFLQFLSDDKNNKENTQKEKVYVHPLVKRSASMLSDKSLEMCTESLGSETGSEPCDDMTSSITLDTDIYTARDMNPPNPRETSMTRRMKRSLSFPPPLTSIRGSKGVQVRPHREGGRLVLEAVTVTTSHTYFHAERSHGRLRLCMMKDCPPNTDNEDHDQSEEDQEEEEDGEDEEEEEEEEAAFDDDDDIEEEEVKEGEDIEGNNKRVRGEMGVVKKVAMLSRCKEGGCANNEILKWDSLWVATST